LGLIENNDSHSKADVNSLYSVGKNVGILMKTIVSNLVSFLGTLKKNEASYRQLARKFNRSGKILALFT